MTYVLEIIHFFLGLLFNNFCFIHFIDFIVFYYFLIIFGSIICFAITIITDSLRLLSQICFLFSFIRLSYLLSNICFYIRNRVLFLIVSCFELFAPILANFVYGLSLITSYLSKIA